MPDGLKPKPKPMLIWTFRSPMLSIRCLPDIGHFAQRQDFHYVIPAYDVIKWKLFPRYWPFMWGIHRSRGNSSHKGQWRGALMFSLICAWASGWANNRNAGDLGRHCPHYDVTVIQCPDWTFVFGTHSDEAVAVSGLMDGEAEVIDEALGEGHAVCTDPCGVLTNKLKYGIFTPWKRHDMETFSAQTESL